MPVKRRQITLFYSYDTMKTPVARCTWFVANQANVVVKGYVSRVLCGHDGLAEARKEGLLVPAADRNLFVADADEFIPYRLYFVHRYDVRPVYSDKLGGRKLLQNSLHG